MIKNMAKLVKIYTSYETGRTITNYAPLRIWLEPTDKCNLACPLCINSSIPESTKGYIEWGLYKKIIDELEGEICDVNLFHRGEPLLHPKIGEMVLYARGKGLNTRIHTNATRLTEELSNTLLRNGLNYISFSFDGFDKETYERNRINADFAKTLNNILNFLKIKKAIGADTFTVLQIIDTNTNINQDAKKNDFLKQFNSLPLNKISIRTPHNWAGGISTGKGDGSVKKPITCTFPWYGLTIFYDGRVVPCCQDYMGKIQLGNINKDSIKDIWNNKIIQEIRYNFSKKDYSKYEPCIKCDRIWRRSAFGVPLEYIGTFLREAKIRK